MPGPGSFLIGDEEKHELLDVLSTGYLSRYGDENDPRFKHKVVDFEHELAAYLGVNHAVAVSSGTGALMACLSALQIGPGDEVIVPGYTFIASISAIIMMGALPVLAEVDESLTIDPEDIKRKISPRTKALMPVHMLGNPCSMDAVTAIAAEHGLAVVEDSCQSAGAAYKEKKCGSIGNVSAFSLNVFKTITAGDGGAVATNDQDLYERLFGFHDQGHKPLRMGLEIGNRSIVGINLRINELTGAVALAQLRKIETIVETLRKKKAALKKHIDGLPGFSFRRLNDPRECGTLLTLIFDSKEKAEALGEKIGASTLAHSGWHVYNNMEQILRVLKVEPHSLPQTDDILNRSINIAVGVVDGGLGSPYGINIISTDEEIEAKGRELRRFIEEL